VEQAFSRFAVHRTQAIVVAAAFPVLVRLALLPLIPIPQPFVPDEFGHLLVGDTFASGRIVNPAHPLWRHFETLYVLQQPTYASQYPIAQGLMLAVPMAFRAPPWFGVCLSIGLMCASVCWMLQGWLPPKWALAGALLAGARWSIVTYWMNSYWGGAAGAIGGTLLLGALPRLLDHSGKRSRSPAVVLAGLGLFVLAQSRPFEGFLLSLPVAALLFTGLARKLRESVPVLTALAGGSALVAGSVLYYDWRVTGNALELPYQLHQRIYGTPPNMLWSAPLMNASRVKAQQDIWDNFEWQLGLFQEQSSWSGFATDLRLKLGRLWQFYFQPILSLPLLFLAPALRRRRIRFLFLTTIFVLIGGLLLYPFFFAHYAAPLAGAILVLILEGARYLRTMQWPRRRFGEALFRWTLATAGLMSCASLTLGGMLCPPCVSTGATGRSLVEDQLAHQSGKHLVFVRYSPKHDFNYPWIYNAASIDDSKIIWARELDAASVSAMLSHYPDRQAWLVNADDSKPELIPYADKDRPQVSAILNAAGKGPFFKNGVAPASLVTLFGRRLLSSAKGDDAACAVPVATVSGLLRHHTPLPGFDASRPGVEIAGVDEPVPSMAMAQPRADSGAIFIVGSKVSHDFPGLSVRFGGAPALVVCTAHTGDLDAVTVLVPVEIPGNSVTLVVRSGENESKPQTVAVLPANPGILQMWWQGRKAALLMHAKGDLVVPSNPARRGETLRLLLTGAGAPTANGPRFPFVVGVNSRGAHVVSVNCSACGSGIAEVRFEVPPETPSGQAVALSAAVAVNGTPIYSNDSVFAVQ
jgi:uncharacterized protein (TIGR03437 family)